MKLSEYLNRPAPVNDRPGQTIFLYVIIAGSILAIFEPFQYRLSGVVQLAVLLGFITLLFLMCLLFFFVLPRIFRNFYEPKEWTVGKNMFHHLAFLILTGFGVFFYDYFLIMDHRPEELWTKGFFYIFYMDMLAAFTIGIIPVSIGLFLSQNRALKQNLEEAKKLNLLLQERATHMPADSGTIVLAGDTKETISLNPEDILYLESSGNYVDVCYWAENEKHKLLRSTIKQMEESLQVGGKFIRCHRAYIVNIDRIANVEGNAQGYRLALRGSSREIPVSRTYMKGIRELLS